MVSEDSGTIRRFREASGGGVATASSSAELIFFWLLSRLRLSGLSKLSYQALQGPETYKGLRIVRLINTALLAKIHTIEWTPALLDHPTARRGLNVNWWGLAGKTVKRLVGRISDNEVISGIVGGHPDHFGVPYSLTEEFVSVYRMHPLIPDDYTFRSVASDEVLQEREFARVAQRQAMELMDQVEMQDLFYSFGTAHPGAITLHNYPRGLQNFQRPGPDGIPQDLAATDIFRSRELGVPRYNDFRRLLHLNPIKSPLRLRPQHPDAPRAPGV